MEKTVSELLQERQNLFIETRKDIENEVNRYIESLTNVDSDILARCGNLAGNTAKEILPALWETPFNEELYEAQLAQFSQHVQCMQRECDKLNEEALRCLTEV